jgi:C-terminal processing protease CtpA/Prc
MPWRRLPPAQAQTLENAVVVHLNTFGVKETVQVFDAALPRIVSAGALVIDVRQNAGGSPYNGYAIIARLIDGPVQGSRWRTRQHLPAFRAWGQRESWYEGDHGMIRPRGAEHFAGPVAVLAGPETAGAAEDFVAVLQSAQRAIVVGETTAGETGQPLMIDLPGGGSARICTTRDLYPDGREFTYVGIEPDVPVSPTLEDYREDRDPALEMALNLIGSAGA